MTDQPSEEAPLEEITQLHTAILETTVHVNMLSDELKDPRTPVKRREQIMAELRQLHALLKQIEEDFRPA